MQLNNGKIRRMSDKKNEAEQVYNIRRKQKARKTRIQPKKTKKGHLVNWKSGAIVPQNNTWRNGQIVKTDPNQIARNEPRHLEHQGNEPIRLFPRDSKPQYSNYRDREASDLPNHNHGQPGNWGYKGNNNYSHGAPSGSGGSGGFNGFGRGFNFSPIPSNPNAPFLAELVIWIANAILRIISFIALVLVVIGKAIVSPPAKFLYAAALMLYAFGTSLDNFYAPQTGYNLAVPWIDIPFRWVGWGNLIPPRVMLTFAFWGSFLGAGILNFLQTSAFYVFKNEAIKQMGLFSRGTIIGIGWTAFFFELGMTLVQRPVWGLPFGQLLLFFCYNLWTVGGFGASLVFADYAAADVGMMIVKLFNPNK
ncbi:MAG: hypothetical protein F6K26_18485 [Moorea sp. SIO2I5]|nr:hypothetical protein [Moorena sp. SIO2I5]